MLIRTFALTLCFLLTTQISAKSGRRKGELKETPNLEDWDEKWFPFDPKRKPAISTEKPENVVPDLENVNGVEDWNLKWFPFDPKKPHTTSTEKPPAISTVKPPIILPGLNNVEETTDWNFKWFPFKPSNVSFENSVYICDDGQHAIEIDFDPNDKRNYLYYRCLSANRSVFKPNLALEALLDEQFIPPAFVPPIKCLNESISYEFPLNTFGAFRPIPPQYGTYLYLPEQRWLHSIAEGAVVMLYHPCAAPLQVKILQDIVSSCLYRHIITPSLALTAQRPLALMAWGKTLQMSVVDERQAVDFIKNNAKRGPLSVSTTFGSKGTYSAGLISEAKLITDINDTEICGYKEM